MSKQSKTIYLIIVLTFIFYFFINHIANLEENILQILVNILSFTVTFLLLNKFKVLGDKLTWQKQLFYCFVFIAFTELLLNYKNVTSSLLTIAGYLGGAIITFLLFTIFSSLGNREKDLAK